MVALPGGQGGFLEQGMEKQRRQEVEEGGPLSPCWSLLVCLVAPLLGWGPLRIGAGLNPP